MSVLYRNTQSVHILYTGTHDDFFSRMKNVEMIELGRHRIKPWYFSPYPQVSELTLDQDTGL